MTASEVPRRQKGSRVPVLSSLLEVLGIAVVAVGLGMWTLWAGIVAAGVGMLALGVLLDPPRAVRRRG